MAGKRAPEDNDDKAREANARAVAEIESAERETPEKEPDGLITIDLDAAEEEEEEGQAATGRNAEARRNRYREQKDAREKAERERDDLRTKYSELEGRLNQLTQQQQAPRPAEGTGQKHPAIVREEQLRQQLRDLSEDFENLTVEAKQKPEIRKRYSDRYQELETERQRVNAFIATGGQQPQNQQQEQFKMMLTARYPDIMHPQKPEYFNYADATYRRLIATGAPDTWETIDKAMDEARRQFRLTKSPPPSQTTKARYSGVGSGATGGATATTARKIELTKEDRTMARAAFPKLKPPEAYKAFAKLLAKGGAEA